MSVVPARAASQPASTLGQMMASAAAAQELCLRDGLAVRVRPVTPDDEDSVWEFLNDLSLDSRRLRFFSAATNLRAQAHLGVAGDDADHHGVLAIAPGRGTVGHAVYVRAPHSERAEVAVVVADDLHHLGLATLLVIGLAQLAESRQITCFFAEVLPENGDMLAVFHDGFAAVMLNGPDVVEVEFPTHSWRAAYARFGSQAAGRSR
jgi:hypothetical protein